MNARKREEIVVQERLAEKQEKSNNQLYKDKEKFITSSYLKQMEMNKQFIKEDLEKEKYNEQNSIMNKGGSASFMRNILDGDDTRRVDIDGKMKMI